MIKSRIMKRVLKIVIILVAVIIAVFGLAIISAEHVLNSSQVKSQIENIVKASQNLFRTLLQLSDKYKSVGMPGYTHTQAAMPSSFGL